MTILFHYSKLESNVTFLFESNRSSYSFSPINLQIDAVKTHLEYSRLRGIVGKKDILK